MLIDKTSQFQSTAPKLVSTAPKLVSTAPKFPPPFIPSPINPLDSPYLRELNKQDLKEEVSSSQVIDDKEFPSIFFIILDLLVGSFSIYLIIKLLINF